MGSLPAQGKKDYSIAIVGGGIGGLCCAIALTRKGIKCDIYESAASFGEIGAGVGLGPNAVRAMHLIDPAIDKGLEKVGTANLWADHSKTWFSCRKGQDPDSKTGTFFHNFHCSGGQTSAHRASFLDELVKLVPDDISHFGKRLASVEDHGSKLTLHFKDGSTATHDAMVGCDGIKSRTRQIMFGDDNPASHAHFSGKYAYRGLIPMDKAVSMIGEEMAKNSQMYFAHGGHMIHFPIAKGKIMNVVAFSSERGDWPHETMVVPADPVRLKSDFEDWVPQAKEVIAMMEKPDCWALFDHTQYPAPTYNKGRMCLLGDAAHASTPHQGANAGQAIEDGLILGNILALVDKSEDLPKALEVYDTMRRARTQKQVATARDGGLLYDLELPGVEDDWSKIKYALDTRMLWIWDHDLDKDIASIPQHLARL